MIKIFLFAIGLFLVSCSGETLKQANLEIASLKSQMPNYHQWVNNTANFYNAIQDTPIKNIQPPQDIRFDTFQYIRLTLFFPFQQKRMIINCKRIDFFYQISGKVFSEDSLSSAIRLNKPVQYLTTTKQINKSDFYSFFKYYNQFNKSDFFSEQTTKKINQYQYDIEIFEQYKNGTNGYTSISKINPVQSNYFKLVKQLLEIYKPDLDRMEDMALKEQLKAI